MKAIYFLLLSMILFVSSCKEEPIASNDKKNIVGTLPNNGVIAGKAYICYSEGDWFKFRNKDIIVSVLGSNQSTVTDSLGNWVLRDIDSGIHILQFSKVGRFDTSYAYNVHSNGRDSMYLKEVITDINWKGSQKTGGDVRELPPNLSVRSGSGIISETILIDTIKDHGTITKIHRDTTYRCEIEFSVGVDSGNEAMNNNLPVSYMFCFTDSPQLTQAQLPEQAFARQSKDKSIQYWHEEIERVKLGEQARRVFTYQGNQALDFQSTAKRYKATKSNNKRLYIHIIPICQGLVRTTDEQWGTPNVIRKQNIMSPAQSFEIQWK